jgi:hypothetical protein
MKVKKVEKIGQKQLSLNELEDRIERDVREYAGFRGPECTVKFLNKVIDKTCGIL